MAHYSADELMRLSAVWQDRTAVPGENAEARYDRLCSHDTDLRCYAENYAHEIVADLAAARGRIAELERDCVNAHMQASDSREEDNAVQMKLAERNLALETALRPFVRNARFIQGLLWESIVQVTEMDAARALLPQP